MNATYALANRPLPPSETDEPEGLTALLALFSADEAPAPATAPAPARPRPSLREAGARLLAWARTSSQRAAAWGSGPQGAWRAW